MILKPLIKFIGYIPAGIYYFGDPCYAFDDGNGVQTSEDWSAFCEAFHSRKAFSLDVDDERVIACPTCTSVDALYVRIADKRWAVAAGTAHGDGSYMCTPAQTSVGVDSGTLAIMTEEFANVQSVKPQMYARFELRLPKNSVVVKNGNWEINGRLFCRTSDDGLRPVTYLSPRGPKHEAHLPTPTGPVPDLSQLGA